MKRNGKLCVGYKTFIGNSRAENQDSIVLRALEQKHHYFIVAAVCDGIGGLEHGEWASQIVIARIDEWYQDISSWIDIEKTDIEILTCHLKDLAEECNLLVRELQKKQNIHTGTTMSLLMIVRNYYFIIQVGDSRIYLYRRKNLCQLTVDASVTKMRNGRLKQYLDNYMGKADELWFSCENGEILPQDIFVICSDGFYHYFGENDMRQYEAEIRKTQRTNEVCDILIHAMMERGERDNISVGFVAV